MTLVAVVTRLLPHSFGLYVGRDVEYGQLEENQLFATAQKAKIPIYQSQGSSPVTAYMPVLTATEGAWVLAYEDRT